MDFREDPIQASTAEEVADDPRSPSCKPPIAPQTSAGTVTGGATICRLHGFDPEGTPLVVGLPELPGEVVPAKTAAPLSQQMIGTDAVVLYENGDPRRPIIVGVLRESAEAAEGPGPEPRHVSIHADSDRLTISADREIVLRCGGASVTLTRAGKIILRGSYVLSRSTGANKIKGASVDIN